MLGYAAVGLLATILIGCMPVPLARTCAEWSRLGAEARLQTVEAYIAPNLLASARERQRLPPGTADSEVFLAVGGSFDKVCEIERQPGLTLTEIATNLYR